ncbi:RDD family protein [Streptomyces sp. 7N604]|uniref:RDD family protein n=1 Tax=Streptomyces sp. 7N604 TaxID=3457415 RepID=UPI003FD120BB
MSELVTGEAVVLGLRPAKLPSRALAVFIDLVIVFAVYIAVSAGLVAATASLDSAARAAVAVATFVLVLVGGPIAVETLSQGRSLGKTACGLRVVRDDGGPIRFRHALVRGAMGMVEILMTFGVVAVIASLVSARGRRLGDVFAGTLVVRERIPVPHAVRMPPPPPWLGGQFGRLDLSRVPDGLWLAVRQYLTRMGQLDQQVSWNLAQRLASDVAGFTGAPVPVGVPPAVYLAGVAGERQARDAHRAFGGVHGNGAGAGGSAWTANAGAWAAAGTGGAAGAWAAPTEPAQTGQSVRAVAGEAVAAPPVVGSTLSSVGPQGDSGVNSGVHPAGPGGVEVARSEPVDEVPATAATAAARTGFAPPA